MVLLAEFKEEVADRGDEKAGRLRNGPTPPAMTRQNSR